VPKLISMRQIAACGAALLVAVGVSASVSADSFRLLQPAPSDTLSYSDDDIAISFIMRPGQKGIGYEGIGFTISNQSTQAIAVDWDRTSMTLPDRQTSNIMHEGTKYISVGALTPPTTIPPGGTLSDSVAPSRNVSLSSSGHWSVKGMDIATGSQFGLYLALDGAGASGGYYFVFEALEAAHVEAEDPLAVTRKMTRDVGVAMMWVLGGLLALGLLGVIFNTY
jgi:hypothetical protein